MCIRGYYPAGFALSFLVMLAGLREWAVYAVAFGGCIVQAMNPNSGAARRAW